ncbi:MAG: VanZ family protein [Candidatus Omnitrophica bacterium]|nr:VanZ family protein [Candidatus Omnitrophota bacterium]
MKFLKWWGPVFLYAGFIFWLSSASRPIPGIQIFPWLDKPLHMIEYLPLGFFILRALAGSIGGVSLSRLHWLAILGALAVAVSDEVYQRFTPMRFSSPIDVGADVVGAAAGQVICWFNGRFYQNKP